MVDDTYSFRAAVKMEKSGMTMMGGQARNTVTDPLPRPGFILRAMLPTFALAAVFWSISNCGYYALIEALALESRYDEVPVLFAGYYFGWTGVALLAFWQIFAG